MGLHDLGYRAWHGTLTPPWMRWGVITETGIRAAWKSRWVRRLLALSWTPPLAFGAAIFAWEAASENPGMGQFIRGMIEVFAASPEMRGMIEMLPQDVEAARHIVWSGLLMIFFRTSQAILVVLMVGQIAPPLISQDVRSRAFLLYFSRPLERSEYILGKAASLWAYVVLLSAAPALVLYLLGILLSPHLNVMLATWDIPLRILLATVILVLPTTSLALLFSSMTQESRYAAFAWFSTWVLGWLAFAILQTAELAMSSSPTYEPSNWDLLSLYHVLGRVQAWAFGFPDERGVMWPALILIAITTFSLLAIYRRVSAPMRA